MPLRKTWPKSLQYHNVGGAWPVLVGCLRVKYRGFDEYCRVAVDLETGTPMVENIFRAGYWIPIESKKYAPPIYRWGDPSVKEEVLTHVIFKKNRMYISYSGYGNPFTESFITWVKMEQTP